MKVDPPLVWVENKRNQFSSIFQIIVLLFFQKIISINPKEASPFVLLGNIYGAAKLYDKQENIRKEMKEKQIKKVPGMSWIELNGVTNTFCVKDISHPNFKEITNEIIEWN